MKDMFELINNGEEFEQEGLYSIKEGEVYTVYSDNGVSLLTAMPFLRKKWMGLPFKDKPWLINIDEYSECPGFFEDLEALKWKGIRKVFCYTDRAYKECIRECKECI